MSLTNNESKKHSVSVEHTRTHLELILERALESGHKLIHLNGTSSSTAISFALSQNNSKDINILPHLVIFPSFDMQMQFCENLTAFDPNKNVFSMPAPDVSPYSGLFPSPKSQQQKINFFVN